MDNLIDRLNKAIDTEYDSKNNEVSEQYKLPLEELVSKGSAISNAQVWFTNLLGTSDGTDISFNTVIVKCPNNISKFREGSPVYLTGHGEQFKLEVTEDNNDMMTLEEGYYVYSVPSHLNGSTGWRIDEAAVDIRNIVKKSTALLSYDSDKFKFLSGILNGKIQPRFSANREAKARILVLQTKLNSSQQEAFVKAFSTDNYYMIQGPPGSGKTWLLAHLAYEFAKEGNKVLITGPTHTSINNALQKASTLSKYPHIIKVGKGNQKEGLNYYGSTARNTADFRTSGYNNDSKGIIVGATCYSPHARKLEFMDWDIIIIDEAGQLSIPLAVAAMAKGKKFIFIGDHKQLPPIISESQTDATFTRSIFEHLFQFAPGTMLTTTYRMNQAINSFPSHQFYNDKLLPEAKNANWLLDIPNNFTKHQEILDINKPEVLFCHFHQSFHSRSEFEADLIAEFVEEYLENGVNADEIAIITPFRAQVRQINKSLSKLTDYESIKDELFVDVIERIQGQERDIVIYSLATSDPIKAEQRAEFFFNPNRFNVALTRARKKRIVVANKDLFEFESKDNKLNSLIQNFKDFYNSAYLVEEIAESGDLF